MKKKLLIDLDVITVAEWEKRDSRREEAMAFLETVGKGTFHVITSTSMLNLPRKWKNEDLAKRILKIYEELTSDFVDDAWILEYLNKRGVDADGLFVILGRAGVKDEDSLLVVVCSTKGASLVTMNRRHLKNKAKEINGILRRLRLPEINILFPSEV